MRPNPHETADLVTFTGEILNGKLHFLCSDVQSPMTLVSTCTLVLMHASSTYDEYVIFFANQPLHNHLTVNACNTFL